MNTQLPESLASALAYLPKLIRGVESQGFQLHDAQQIAQETLVKFVEEIRNGDVEIRFVPAWLRRVASNIGKDYRKKCQPQPGYTPGPNDPIDPGTAPLDGLYYREAQDALLHAIQELPDQLQRVVALWVQDCTCEEIATALGLKVGTVRSQVHRALKRLRVILVKHR